MPIAYHGHKDLSMQPSLTSGRLLVRNSALNVAGKLIPMAIAIVTMPYVIQHLGDDRAGIFQFCWILLGYFNLFDFGFGRALVKFASERLASGAGHEIPDWTTTVNRVLWRIAVPLAIVMLVVLPAVMAREGSIPAEFADETRRAAMGIALYIPFLLTFFSHIGILETWQRFDLINRYQIIYGILWYLLPVIAIVYTQRIDILVGILLVLRMLHWGVIRYHARKLLIGMPVGVYRKDFWSPLFDFSRWIVVINSAALVIAHLDRLLIYWVLSSAALAWYNTPFDVVLKVTIIPMAFAGVLFPAIAHATGNDPSRARYIYNGYRNVTLMVVFPICAGLGMFAPELLQMWLGLSMDPDRVAVFLTQSTLPMQWFAWGVFATSVALIPSSYLQSKGRPDLIAKLHLAEIPVFLLMVWFGIHYYGLAGVAGAVAIRMVFDAIVLLWLARDGDLRGLSAAWEVAWPIVLALALFFPAWFVTGWVMKSTVLVLSIVLFTALIWTTAMQDEERVFIQAKWPFRKTK